jgi:hypothetical protein
MNLLSKYPTKNRGTVVVWGLLASYPFGGMTWQVLHYVAGLRRLGFDVWYVEDSDRYVLSTATLTHRTANYSANVEYLSSYMKSLGLGDRWIFRPPGTKDTCCGARNLTGLLRLYQEADAVFNLCGAQEMRHNHSSIRCRVYIETDPVENQVRVATGEKYKIEELDSYDYLFTYAENLGAPDCIVPVERHHWYLTRPPVCVDWWKTANPPAKDAALTTVMRLKHRSKEVVWKGKTWHWSKDFEFRRFINIPSRSALPLELAIMTSDEDMAELHRQGWRTIPASLLNDPGAYNSYICASIGEFTVAKEQYVGFRTGWFSDRSVCYLAAGRPVIMQDTGFGNIIPTGEGLFPFITEDDALMAIDAVARDYGRHSAAARMIAHEFFDAELVIGDVLKKIGLI